MMTTLRAVARTESLSAPLPSVHELNALYSLGFKPRRGEVILIGARSGAAKSSLMIWLAVRLGLRTLYWSLDQNLRESTYRALAAQTGETVDEVELHMKSGQVYQGEVAPITWCFEKNPSIGDLQEELDAYVEATDSWPEIMVVDNLVNVYHGREGDKAGYDDALKFLNEKAAETNATIFVLAHTSKSVKPNNPHDPQPKYALLDSPDKYPQQILMLGLNPQTGELRVAVAKSRMTLSDETSENYVSLQGDQARCTFRPWLGGHRYEYAS